MQIIIVFVTQLLLPAGFILWLACMPATNTVEALLRIVVVSTGLAYLALVNRWDWLGLHLRLLIGIAALLAATRLIWHSHTLWPSRSSDDLVTLAVLLVVEALMIAQLGPAWQACRQPNDTSLDLAMPVLGKRWYVAHGGSGTSLNYHYRHPAQRYAVDLVRLSRSGRRSQRLRPRQLQAYHAFGQPVLSPVAGIVLAAIDGHPDMIPPARDRTHPAGNHVVIRLAGRDVYVLLAHLRTGSVCGSVGDRVNVGDPIGVVGNSGNSTEPHLHMHCATIVNQDVVHGGVGVPFTIGGIFPVRNRVLDG